MLSWVLNSPGAWSHMRSAFWTVLMGLSVTGCYATGGASYANGAPFDLARGRPLGWGEVSLAGDAGLADYRQETHGKPGIGLGVAARAGLAQPGFLRLELGPELLVLPMAGWNRSWMAQVRVAVPVGGQLGGGRGGAVLSPEVEGGLVWLDGEGTRSRSIATLGLFFALHLDIAHADTSPVLGLRFSFGESSSIGPTS